MKIYTDLASDYMRPKQECGGDCGSPSLAPGEKLAAFDSSMDIAFAEEGLLEQSRTIYTQKCNDAHWLVCCTSDSGRMAVLDQEAFELFEQFKIAKSVAVVRKSYITWPSSTFESIVSFLYSLGFLQEKGRLSGKPEKNTPETLVVWLHTTNACNLRCDYCYIQKTQESMQIDIGYKSIDAVFRSALRHHIRFIHLKYAGGEASLHMNGVIALHDYAEQLAQKHGITLSAVLLSNGVYLSDKSIERLRVHNIGVSISLDGIGESHDRQRFFSNGQGSSKYVLRTIERLLVRSIVPSISVTVSQRNLDGLPTLMRYLLANELPFSLNYYREHTSVLPACDLHFEDQAMISAMRSVFRIIEETLPQYSLLNALLDKADAQKPHTNTCTMGHNYLVIDQRGRVSKCQAQIQQHVTTIEQADPLQVIREHREGVQNLAVDEKEGCRSCDWRYWCTGGCPLLTYQVTGRNDIRSPNCNIYKALFPDILQLEALRLLTYCPPFLYEAKRPETIMLSANAHI